MASTPQAKDPLALRVTPAKQLSNSNSLLKLVLSPLNRGLYSDLVGCGGTPPEPDGENPLSIGASILTKIYY